MDANTSNTHIDNHSTTISQGDNYNGITVAINHGEIKQTNVQLIYIDRSGEAGDFKEFLRQNNGELSEKKLDKIIEKIFPHVKSSSDQQIPFPEVAKIITKELGFSLDKQLEPIAVDAKKARENTEELKSRFSDLEKRLTDKAIKDEIASSAMNAPEKSSIRMHAEEGHKKRIIGASRIILLISVLFMVPVVVIPLITHDFYIQSIWGILWIISVVLLGVISIAEFVLVGLSIGGLINAYSVLAFMGWFIEVIILVCASLIGELISNKRFFLYTFLSVPFFLLPIGVAMLVKKKSRKQLKRRLPHLISMFFFMFVFSMPVYVWREKECLVVYFNEANIGDGIYYEWVYTINDDNTLTVHMCFDKKDIVVPRTINGRIVTAIGANVRAKIDGVEARTVRSITIHDNVITIESFAFGDYDDLKYIFIPNSVTEIGYAAFSRNSGNLTIYCEAPSKPTGWEAGWNSGNPVVWGYKEQS